MILTEGIYGIYKPKGPSSHFIINRLRRLTHIKRIGHAGTLDPLASGVLVVGIGRAFTKQLTTEVAKEKEYVVTIKLGESSTTYDAEGEKKIYPVDAVPTLEQISKALESFVGVIKQMPPVFSSIKIKGKAMYKRARKSTEPLQFVDMLQAREVEIRSIDVLEYVWPFLKLRVTTGPGVYIRSLAFDLGEVLRVGGYVFELERTRVGEFELKNSLQIEGL